MYIENNKEKEEKKPEVVHSRYTIFEHIELNFDNKTLHTFFPRFKRRLLITSGVLLVAGITYFSIPDEKMTNSEFYNKYYKEALENMKQRETPEAYKDLSNYYKAMFCFQEGKEHEAIPVFEELIAKNVMFKDKCLWNLAGCYMAMDMQDDKIIKILTEIIDMKSEYSPLALEILNEKVNK